MVAGVAGTVRATIGAVRAALVGPRIGGIGARRVGGGTEDSVLSELTGTGVATRRRGQRQ